MVNNREKLNYCIILYVTSCAHIDILDWGHLSLVVQNFLFEKLVV